MKEGDRIAQVIIERINTSDKMEVDRLELIEWAHSGFRSTDMSPNRIIIVTDTQPMICFLQADSSNNEYCDIRYIGNYPGLSPEYVLMSSVIILQVEMKVFEADFISTVVTASKRNLEWTARKRKLDRLQNEGMEFPKTGWVKTDSTIIRIDYRSQTTKDWKQPSQKDVTIRKWQGIWDKRKPLKSSTGTFTEKDSCHG